MDKRLQQKILKFENFINETLKGDLAAYEKKLDTKTSDVAEFIQLRTMINTLKSMKADEKGFKTKLDLGNSIFVQAKVDDASTILLNAGLGHFVELSLEEALHIIDIRIKLLEKQIEHLRKQIAQTKAHIKLTLLALQELQNVQIKDQPVRRVVDL